MINSRSKLDHIAKAGLVAKGIVYLLLGMLTFMAAFHINGKSTHEADRQGVFRFLASQTGGQAILAIIALGLVCYCIWRFVQAFLDTNRKGKKAKGVAVRTRYFLSGLIYGGVAVQIVRMLAAGDSQSGDSFSKAASKLMESGSGQLLTGAVGLIFAGIGIYQIYYGLSEKYKKHVEETSDKTKNKLLLMAGKIGFAARGIVWLLISWLLLKAAVDADASEAGDTSKAFGFLKDSSYGQFLLAAIAIGLICYGIFNFIRARHEKA